MNLTEKLQKNAELSAEKTKSEVLPCTVLSISQSKAVEKNGKSYPKLMVVTKEFGNLFPFENQVINRLTAYGTGIPAKLVVTATTFKDKEGKDVESFNVNNITLEPAADMINSLDKIRLASQSGAQLTF